MKEMKPKNTTLIFHPIISCIAVISCSKEKQWGKLIQCLYYYWLFWKKSFIFNVSYWTFSAWLFIFILQIEVLSPVNGDIQTTISDASGLDDRSEENNIVGLHLFGKQNSELDSRYINTCCLTVYFKNRTRECDRSLVSYIWRK